MSYAAVEKQLHSVPEEYLDELSEYIESILYKANRRKSANVGDTSCHFGAIKALIDGMKAQKSMRDEWR